MTLKKIKKKKKKIFNHNNLKLRAQIYKMDKKLKKSDWNEQ